MSFSEMLISLKTLNNTIKNKIITYHDSLQQIRLKSKPNHTHDSLEKMSLFIPSYVKGSITVETAVVLPVFLFFMLTIFVFFDVIYEQGNYQRDYAQIVKNVALLSLESEEELILLKKSYKTVSPISFFPRHEVKGHVSVGARAWTGLKAESPTMVPDGYQKVYVTESGTVYHTHSECSYLNPSVSIVSKNQINTLRNISGEIYRECELCEPRGNVHLYVTESGNRYHKSLLCSGLKRNIFIVDLEDTFGYRKCARCESLGY